MTDGAHFAAEQSLIHFAKPATHFTTHVHLDHRELFDVLLIDSMQVRNKDLNPRAVSQCNNRPASRKQIHERHFAKAVALDQVSQDILLVARGRA